MERLDSSDKNIKFIISEDKNYETATLVDPKKKQKKD